MRAAAIVLLALFAGPAGAAPETSPYPKARPQVNPAEELLPQTEPDGGTAAAVRTPGASDARPRPRPLAALREPTDADPEPQPLVVSSAAVARSLRPRARPGSVTRRQVAQPMLPVQPAPAVRLGRKGSVCGIESIRGVTLKAIPGRIQGCGVDEPVQVTAIGSIGLSAGAVMDCTTARALDAWVRQAVVPKVGRTGGGVARLEVAAHYACRSRNNVKGARISEHGRGRAIDISGITLKNGSTITVLKGWNDPAQGRLLKALHEAACGPFGTVLGPNSDRFHADHLHLDTARYRSGSYCR